MSYKPMWGMNTDSACLGVVGFDSNHPSNHRAGDRIHLNIPEDQESCFPEANVPVQEVVITIHFLDAIGHAQQSSTRTSQAAHIYHKDAKKFKKAIGDFYASLGYILISIQISVENTVFLEGLRQPPKLSVVKSPKLLESDIDIRL